MAENETATDTRDFLREAQAIVRGESLLLPQREHLLVLQQEVNKAAQAGILMNRALISVLLDQHEEVLTVHGQTVAAIGRERLDLVVQQHKPTGSIIVQLLAPHRGPTN